MHESHRLDMLLSTPASPPPPLPPPSSPLLLPLSLSPPLPPPSSLPLLILMTLNLKFSLPPSFASFSPTVRPSPVGLNAAKREVKCSRSTLSTKKTWNGFCVQEELKTMYNSASPSWSGGSRSITLGVRVVVVVVVVVVVLAAAAAAAAA